MESVTPAALHYPLPSETALKVEYVGRPIQEVPAPAVVIDAAVIRKNCKYMLETVKTLGCGFRAHVKTHKVCLVWKRVLEQFADPRVQTIQLAMQQVGTDSTDIRLLCSTVAESEHLLGWLLRLRRQRRKVNIIHGLPLAPSAIPRLARIAKALGPGSISVLVDHPQQVHSLLTFVKANPSAWPGHIPVMIKIDTGYHRAGLAAKSTTLRDIISAAGDGSQVTISGVYAHHGHSYSAGSPSEALSFLRTELSEAVAGAETVLAHMPDKSGSDFLISIGATPTATATQNLLTKTNGAAAEVARLIEDVKGRFSLEIHAGVYPVLDMQQLATAARPATIDQQSRLTMDDIGLRVLVEVASVYEERDKPEALIAAGSIVLGREPCKSYPGWGVMTAWKEHAREGTEGRLVYEPHAEKTGWIVGRISQEHGILTWEGPPVGVRQLAIGEKVMIWPNHACMAGPSFAWYYVVDSDIGNGQVVTDIWVRCRGW